MSFRSRTRVTGAFYIPGFPKGVKWLLISNVAIFIIGFFAQLVRLDRPLSFLALTPALVVKDMFVWQLATYAFLHGGFGHIIFNMLALWMFGAELERIWGTQRFLRFYFYCAVGAGICVVIANYVLPWGNPNIATLGSSGAIFGILMVYALLFPDREMLWAFLIPIKVKYFVMIIGAITFMQSYLVTVGGMRSGVAVVAHLGGMVVGYLILRGTRLKRAVQEPAVGAYKDWKLRRAKKKFEVYLRKKDSDRDRWIN
jgi:membrane associated rhomboid family serine protease